MSFIALLFGAGKMKVNYCNSHKHKYIIKTFTIKTLGNSITNIIAIMDVVDSQSFVKTSPTWDVQKEKNTVL